MAKSLRFGAAVSLLCCIVVISLHICSSYADEGYNYHPLDNVNLTPFIQYLSIYQCMLNYSQVCPDKHYLKESGWVNVTEADRQTFCNGGCREHTEDVLECISLVKKNYKFADRRTVDDLKDIISQGCAFGFPDNGVLPPPPNSGIRAVGGRLAIGLSVLSAVLMAYSQV